MKKSPVSQSSVLHQHGRHWSAAFIDARFEHRAGRGRIGIGFEFAQVGHQQNRFEQFIQIYFLLGRNFDTITVSPPHSAGIKSAFRELPLHAFELASGLSILLMATMIGTLAALA